MTQAPVPVITGSGRSGTSLLRLMLNGHQELSVARESFVVATEGWDTALHRFERDLFLERLETLPRFDWWDIPPELRDELRAKLHQVDTYEEAVRLLSRTQASASGKPRYGLKDPEFVRHLEPCARRWPEMRFIHLIRDGRNVALSLRAAEFGPDRIEEAIWGWNRAVREGIDSGERLGPSRYLPVRYEELVEDPEAVLRTICEFIELEFDPAMLEYHLHPEEINHGRPLSPHQENLKRPPIKNVRDWRIEMTKSEVAYCQFVAGTSLADLGYPTVPITRGRYPSVVVRHAGLHIRRGRRLIQRKLA